MPEDKILKEVLGAHALTTSRAESIDKAEAILLQARKLHDYNAMIEFNLACYASVTAASTRQRPD